MGRVYTRILLLWEVQRDNVEGGKIAAQHVMLKEYPELQIKCRLFEKTNDTTRYTLGPARCTRFNSNEKQ